MSQSPADPLAAASDWWRTAIVDIAPGVIRLRGYAIEDLIGRLRFAEVIWLMLKGELPSPGQTELLDCILVASVDHGPQAPSIAIARMATTCGLPVNGAMASAINVLDDVHGGAGEQCLRLYLDVLERARSGEPDAALEALTAYQARHGKIIPGFGHRFHPVDPRTPRLIAALETAQAAGVVQGHFLRVARQLEAALQAQLERPIPMNIDGATALICGELGFAPAEARGLFILSRAVGILAHAIEERSQGQRLKGPMPPSIRYRYIGAAARPFPIRP